MEDEEQEVSVPKFLIGPNSQFKFLWNVLMFAIVVQIAVVMPVRMAFFDE